MGPLKGNRTGDLQLVGPRFFDFFGYDLDTMLVSWAFVFFGVLDLVFLMS